MTNRLIVISNRVPLAQSEAGPSVGGLAMALTSALREHKGLWFGWSGVTVDHYTGEVTSTESQGIDFATVDLEEQDVQEYYNGFANKTLWPLFHYRIDLTEFERSYDEGYARVNRRFAAAVEPILEPEDMIWVHDYHLIPLGRELRALGAKHRMGFFLHIPWPATEMLTTLPKHRQLVEAMFEYDVVGFQTVDHLHAFVSYVTSEVGTIHESDRLTAFGRTITARAFPIGIDTEEFEEMGRSRTAIDHFNQAAATNAFRSMIIGVDRIDYSKGLEERFVAFEALLVRYPELRRQVVMLQIAQTSRESVEAYQDIRLRLEAVTGRINGAYATVDWEPIRYVNSSYGRDALWGLYRAARIGMVTPLRDGMNLVAKEYVAAQDPANPGVLILSRFAGAATQLKQALIVNPYSREDMTDAIKRALDMPLIERRSRWETLIDNVRTQNVSAWRDAFVAALEAPLPG
jgi:trehalose 6-phosphate synthase